MARITGVQHIAVAVNDMREALKLYRDILGMELKSAQGAEAPLEETGMNRMIKLRPTRLYNFDMGNGSVLTIVEVKEVNIKGRKSSFAVELWPGEEAPGSADGVDHVGLNVDTEADLIALHTKLRDAGYRVSDIQRLDVNPWWKQFFFYDKDGNAWEITTWDWQDPAWEKRRAELEGNGKSIMFNDPDPVY
jgi:catechol 2,3-dioxygenase-like lactoylglutathione lyase family enzyme